MPLIRRTNRVRRSLRLGVLDGAAFSAMVGLTQSYITPFALALKATTQQIGLLASIPSFTTALSQLAAPAVSEIAGGRKKLILPIVFGHALMWLPILLVAYVIPAGAQVWSLIAFVTVSAILGSFASPAWGSLMADLVPANMRGRYFSFRGRISVFIMLIFGIIAGGILQVFRNAETQGGGTVFTGFAIIFGGAFVFRLLSWYFLSGMYEPRSEEGGKDTHSMLHMLKHLGSSNLGRFTLYVALISFATNIAGPFFSVFQLRDLKFSYVTYMAIASVHAIANLTFQTFWGGRADRAGNIRVIKTCSVLLPIIPLQWLLSTNRYYLMGAEVISGLAWAGFNLAASNYVYDASEPHNRTKQIALFNVFNMLAASLGALAGGYLAPYLPQVLGYDLRAMFLLSGVARGAVVLVFIRSLVEVRKVPKLSFKQFLTGR